MSNPTEGQAPQHVTELPMVCDCDDEGRAAAEAMMAEVYQRLAQGTSELLPREVNMENFLSEVSRSLWWNMKPGVSIHGIYSDQWFGVKAGTDHETEQVFVACDRVEHGIAAIWKYYADRGGVAVNEKPSAPQDVRLARSRPLRQFEVE